MNNQKVLVVGIDGATFKIISHLMKDGRLPHITKLIDNGVHGVLNSIIPTVSPVAWTSFMTGRKPNKHGIYDFSGKIPGTYRFEINTAENRKAKPLWMNLSEENKRVFILGVTMTYPPDPINGYMISGLGIPPQSDMKSYVYPPDFATEIINNLGEYHTTPDGDLRKLNKSDKEKEKYLQGILNQIDYRVRLFKYMWQKEHFDFSMIFFLDTDGVSHYFWRYMDTSHKRYIASNYSDAIYKVYEMVDKAIGEILDTVTDEINIVLVSDHGFGPLNRIVFLNNWLKANGYLKVKNISKLNVLLSKILSLIRLKKRDIKKEIDWQNTKAYFSGTIGSIFINLRGREPEGIVDIADYNYLCDKLKMSLSDLRDPETGENIIEYIYKRDEVFGSKDASAPDLLVTFKKGYGVVGEEIGLHNLKDRGEIITDSNNWSGTHEPEGIFIAYGRSFKKGYKVKNANIIDLAPTLLYLLGVHIPKGMDGKVLKDIFVDGYLESHLILYIEEEDMDNSKTAIVYKEDDREKVLKQLRNLGYID